MICRKNLLRFGFRAWEKIFSNIFPGFKRRAYFFAVFYWFLVFFLPYPPGPLVPRSSGHVVLWSLDRLVFSVPWSSGLLASWSCDLLGAPFFWSLGPPPRPVFLFPGLLVPLVRSVLPAGLCYMMRPETPNEGVCL